MTPDPSLRERKKQRTHAAISDAALRLFLTNGFDAVSVVQIAAAAEVSKRTLFKYFPTKEDLVVNRFADHVDDAARVVRDRARGQAPLTALRAAFRAGLDNREPSTGLCDAPEVLACYRLVLNTPTLTARLAQFLTSGEVALAEALGPPGDLDARLAASAIIAVQRNLGDANQRELVAGHSAAQRHPIAVAEAERAFDLLADGIGDRFRVA
ncbi:TetR family transcriptional regulator [Nocardia tengchongensis]|uniref:TetR family transcriptional regulator n=1 Tax=Nocardia tengchongensis TaxID=2055889 RepID=A0ABX8CQA0_9NOCA|nr:TetR family transcriptional regulator [Nocardia tengchongensis]QVI21657.1 TetR family transcriptional regulator [Nocardia tengchongensis]